MRDVKRIEIINFQDYLSSEMSKHLGHRWQFVKADVEAAMFFGAGAHAGQVRKGTGVRYLVHPMHVASILAKRVANVPVAMLQAALLHDTVEDTPVTAEDIAYYFDPTVADLVIGMTKVEVEGNRETRKAAERDRLRQESPEVQTIKGADIYSNTRTMKTDKPDFFPQYFAEQELLFAELDAMDPHMHTALTVMFEEYRPS